MLTERTLESLASIDDGPKHPEIIVDLSGGNGNAFSIMGRVRDALSENDIPDEEIEKFTTEAMSGDYDHLLQTVMRWVDFE